MPGEIVNAFIIIAMVLLSIALNFVQSFRSQRAAQRLRQQAAPMATVLRGSRGTRPANNSLREDVGVGADLAQLCPQLSDISVDSLLLKMA